MKHGAFGKEFAKTKALDPKYHSWLLAAFKNRQSGTYEVDPTIDPDDISEGIAHAVDFLAAARYQLEKP